MAVRLQDLKRLMRDKQRKEGRLVEEEAYSKQYLRYSKKSEKKKINISATERVSKVV
jgi:hypothetical protein